MIVSCVHGFTFGSGALAFFWQMSATTKNTRCILITLTNGYAGSTIDTEIKGCKDYAV